MNDDKRRPRPRVLPAGPAKFSLKYNPQPKVANGWYFAGIEDMQVQQSRHGDFHMVTFLFRAHGSVAETYLYRVSLTRDDIPRLHRLCRAGGIDYPGLDTLLREQRIDAGEYIGTNMLIHLVPEQYQGKWRSTIRDLQPLSKAQMVMAVLGKDGPEL